jgi:hypothetical protein
VRKSDEQYPAKEAEERLEAALRGARVAEPKPMKGVPRKRAESKKKLGAASKPPRRAKKES